MPGPPHPHRPSLSQVNQDFPVLVPLYHAYSGLCFFSAILFLAAARYGRHQRWVRAWFAGLSLIAMFFMLALEQVSVSSELQEAIAGYRLMYRTADLFFLLYPGFVMRYYHRHDRWPFALTVAWAGFILFREYYWHRPEFLHDLQLVYIEYPWGEKIAWFSGIPAVLTDTRALLTVLSSLAASYFALQGSRGPGQQHNPVFLAATLLMLLGQLWDQSISVGLLDGLYVGEHTFIAFIAALTLDLVRDLHQGDRARRHLERLSMEMALAEQRQRQELANDLHDGPVQHLSLALLQLDAGNPERARISELVRKATRSIRSVVFRLNPPALERLGLEAALAQLAEDTENMNDVNCEFSSRCGRALEEKTIQVILYQCVRELVTNAVKHADCRNIRIDFRCDDDLYLIAVQDDGKGFEVADKLSGPSNHHGYGIFSLQQRLLPVGGHLSVESSRNGTRATIRVPMVHDT